MTRLKEAMMAANERKMASMGGDAEGVTIADTELQDRAVFGGFDIEYGELVSTSSNVADQFMYAARHIGLRALFVSSWCDGLLTGLLLASLPTDPDATDGIGIGEE